MNKPNIIHHLCRTFSALAVAGALFTLPSATGDTRAILPLTQAKPDLTLAPALTSTPTLRATTWYVPGILDDYANDRYSTYYVLNPGAQAGLVTLTFKGSNATVIGSVTATIEPMLQYVFASINLHDPLEIVGGYMVITSEVPVFVHAIQNYTASDGTQTIVNLRETLDAYPVR